MLKTIGEAQTDLNYRQNMYAHNWPAQPEDPWG